MLLSADLKMYRSGLWVSPEISQLQTTGYHNLNYRHPHVCTPIATYCTRLFSCKTFCYAVGAREVRLTDNAGCISTLDKFCICCGCLWFLPRDEEVHKQTIGYHNLYSISKLLFIVYLMTFPLGGPGHLSLILLCSQQLNDSLFSIVHLAKHQILLYCTIWTNL